MAESKVTTFSWKINAAGSYAAAGLLLGGDPGVEVAWKKHNGGGGTELAFVHDLPLKPTLELEVTDSTKTLLTAAQRASFPYGAQTETLHLQYGTDAAGWVIGGPMGAADAITNTCAIDRLTCSWKEHDTLKASFEFAALNATRDTNGIAQVALAGTDKPFTDGTGVITIATADLTCIGMEIGVSHNYKVRSPAVARETNEAHFSTKLEQGFPEVTATFDVLAPAGIDLAADTQAHNLGAVATFDNGPTTVTFTLTNMGYRREPFQLRERDDGLVVWSLDFDCYGNSLVIS